MATFTLEFPYRRSVGPVVGAFLTALRDGELVGIKTKDGRVLCPPLEYDPANGDGLSEIVPVGPGGTVEQFAWVSEPLRRHPLDRPFAWALIKIDGADTALLHAVDSGSRDAISVGTRVTPRWAEERKGHISDIACFVPEGSS